MPTDPKRPCTPQKRGSDRDSDPRHVRRCALSDTVADQQAGLQVINYLAYDSQGTPPTITAVTTNYAAGVAEDDQLMRVTAQVAEDVQVRMVEFYKDDELIATDGSYPFEVRFVTPRIAEQSTFTLQVRATDTGGNSAQTEAISITLVPDATPPRALQLTPADGSHQPGATFAMVAATFNEPIDPLSVNANSFQLSDAGLDLIFNTDDDRIISNGTISYDAANHQVQMSFALPLSEGIYQAILTTAISDQSGNQLSQPIIWSFGTGFPVRWDGGGDGLSWHDPLNWDTDALPGPTDRVIIDLPDRDITVVHDRETHQILSMHSTEALNLANGTLTISSAANLNGPFTFSGGVLDGTGVVTVTGPLTWNGGIIVATDNATWNNLPGSIFDIQHDGTFSASGSNTTFNNQGTVRKSAGAGETIVHPVFINSGSVVADSREIAFRGGYSRMLPGSSTCRLAVPQRALTSISLLLPV